MPMIFTITDDDVVDVSPVDGHERRYVVHTDHDPDTTINEFDCYGTVETTRNSPNTGRSQRPSGFDGSSRVLDRGHISTTWWQPHPETADADAVFDLVHQLYHEGFLQVGLELQEQLEDSTGNFHWVTLAEAWIGGVDTLRDRHYRAQLLTDLAADIDVQLGVTA